MFSRPSCTPRTSILSNPDESALFLETFDQSRTICRRTRRYNFTATSESWKESQIAVANQSSFPKFVRERMVLVRPEWSEPFYPGQHERVRYRERPVISAWSQALACAEASCTGTGSSLVGQMLIAQAGPRRGYIGSAGKITNCQIGVFTALRIAPRSCVHRSRAVSSEGMDRRSNSRQQDGRHGVRRALHKAASALLTRFKRKDKIMT